MKWSEPSHSQNPSIICSSLKKRILSFFSLVPKTPFWIPTEMREHLEPVSTASWTRPKTVTWQPSASSDSNPCERTRARDATWGHEGTCWSQCCGRLVCVDDGAVFSRSQERRPFLEAKPAVVIINRGCSYAGGASQSVAMQTPFKVRR